jgi:3-hydroxymyristoyl/3-hydroxydecanoyl-(acyl carrier protein) dehydratase
MRRLPEILAERTVEQGVELELRVPGDLEMFAGHFPGAPVLPGVVQLDWCVRLARDRLPLRGVFRAMEQVKFLAPIAPEARVTLHLELKAGGARLDFRFFGRENKYSSGTFLFGA